MQDKIEYNGNTISYELIRSKRRKTIAIIADGDKVIVRAPECNTISEIKQVLQNNGKQILRLRLKQKRKKPDMQMKKNCFLYSGEVVPYVIHRSQESDKVVLKNNKFHIFTTQNSIDSDYIIRVYYDWLLSELVPYIEKKIKFFSKMTNLNPTGLTFKTLSSRWGSLQPNNIVQINYHLLKTPRKIIDYVVLHEIVHIEISGHGPEFWSFLKHFMPDYEHKKKWLIRNSKEILHSEDYV